MYSYQLTLCRNEDDTSYWMDKLHAEIISVNRSCVNHHGTLRAFKSTPEKIVLLS